MKRALHINDSHDMSGFFGAVNAIHGPNTQGPVPPRAKKGYDLIRHREAVKERLENHLNSINEEGS